MCDLDLVAMGAEEDNDNDWDDREDEDSVGTAVTGRLALLASPSGCGEKKAEMCAHPMMWSGVLDRPLQDITT